jgi:hypothetical protein
MAIASQPYFRAGAKHSDVIFWSNRSLRHLASRAWSVFRPGR